MKKTSIYFIILIFSVSILCLQACHKDELPVANALSVKNYYPNSGNAGTLVTILGTGFSADGEVSFAGQQAEVISQNDTALVVRAPKQGQTGDIQYKAEDKTVKVGNYTYQELSVQSFTPGNGPAGMHIRISGAGFGSLNSPAEVLVNGVKARVVSVSDTLIVAEIPENAGSGPVTVQVDGKTSSGAIFNFQSIAGIKPITGGAGTKVTIKGAGFEGTTAGNVVEFNGKQAEVLEATPGQLVVVAPQGVTTGPLSISINGQKTTGPAFTVVPLPRIITVSPLSGPAGQEMTITGLNFSIEKEENIVKINGTAVPVQTAAGNKLTLILPGGTGTGRIELSVNDQLVQGPEFRDQQLGIISIQPSNGLAGTQVTITGTGFSTVAAENQVTFNGITAVVVSATETSIVVTAPAAVTSGPIKIRRAALEAQSPLPFLRAGMTTLAGGPSSTLLSQSMSGIAVDSKGNVFVTNRNMYNVNKITPDGTVSLFAGSATGEYGRKDGIGTDAVFSSLNSIVIDPQDNIFVSEGGNGNSIRKITPAGIVTTIKTGLTNVPYKLCLDKDGNIYATQTYAGMLKIYPNGATVRTYTFTVSDPCRPAIDAAGNTYFAVDDYEAFLGQYTAAGQGTYRWLGSSQGHQDGPMASALFSYGISGLLIDADGNLVILDKNNYAIRKLDFATKEVSTLMKVSNGYADGSFAEAKMSFSTIDMAFDKEGNLYLLDQNNKAVRKVFFK
jgi:sugar lactone lactonase YvrE